MTLTRSQYYKIRNGNLTATQRAQINSFDPDAYISSISERDKAKHPTLYDTKNRKLCSGFTYKNKPCKSLALKGKDRCINHPL